MSSSLVTVVVVALLVLTTIIVSTLLFLRRRGMLAQLSDHERDVHAQCAAADKAVRAAQRAHDRAVREAKSALKKAQTPERLATAGFGNYVTAINVCLNGRTHPLSENVVAALDGQGDITAYATQRSTLTRIATGAVLAGGVGAIVGGLAKKTNHHKIDTRELYLMVLGPDWQEVVKLSPEQGDKARSLMQGINVAAKNSIAAAARHAEGVSAAEGNVERIIADTSAVDTAKAARSALGEDPLTRLKRRGAGDTAVATAARTSPAPGLARFDDSYRGDGPQDVVRARR